MSDQDKPRLIEVAFPLKQASLDSVHEKNVRHGHISTLHIWPARRPLAACRAALIATLLPDPGNEVERNMLLDKLAGKVKKENTFKIVNGRKIPVVKEFTEGGILHWGRESGTDLDFFREEIKKAYGGRAPKVLDPFAGGGAIPLEAMRLGCEATAVDINPVAWFILKCTLEYPQKLTGQKLPLPKFALESPEFMAEYLKTEGRAGKNGKKHEKVTQCSMLEAPEADLAGHVRAWGWWVLERARKDLEKSYPTIDGKPTVAYLWARTVTCKNCRATLPLLKTLWLCKKEKKRIRLEMKPRADRSGVDFEIVNEPVVGGNATQRARDEQLGRGTMSRAGAWCPVCGGPNTVAMTVEDIRREGMAGRLGSQMTAVAVDGDSGKEYRIPVAREIQMAQEAAACLDNIFKDIPFGLPTEPTPKGGGSGAGRAFSVQNYGMNQWYKLFTPRQLLALGTFVKHTRAAHDAMRAEGYPKEWGEAVSAYLAVAIDRIADSGSGITHWQSGGEFIVNTFQRFALPINWDFAEANSTSGLTGSFQGALEWILLYIAHAMSATQTSPNPKTVCSSAIESSFSGSIDFVLTDPPYYDAIPYSDCMDFFHIWLRRTLHGLSPEIDATFKEPLAPKWDSQKNDGELIDDASRFGGDAEKSRAAYEDGMYRAFVACNRALNSEGRLVVVFASKQPEAWERLASALIRAGFVVDASWPIQTERLARTRSLSSAALASSVWLVCRKRAGTARPGWEDHVLDDMKSRIGARLNQFWDAGIRGPDLIWAATGPALEAYSQHPFVKKADQPDAVMPVSEFLRQVRRIVTGYMVGHLLSENGNGHAAEGLDDVTLYYLLHRQSFGLEDAPVGACILYAQSCKLADRDLTDKYDVLAHGESQAAGAEDDEETGSADEDSEEAAKTTSGSTVRLKKWDQRQRKDLGLNQSGKVAPLIDQVHRIMQLWRVGDVQNVDTYVEQQGLRRNPVFPKLVQALIELAGPDTDERRLLESIQNQITARGAHPQTQQMRLPGTEEA